MRFRMKDSPSLLRFPWVGLVSVFFGVAASAYATNVGGTLSTNTTWSLSGSPYLVTNAVVVSNGVLLTIEPGVTIEVRSNSPIQVSGTLSAIGSSNQPIVFTKVTGEEKAPAIQIVGLSPSNMSATGIFNYCQFSYMTNGNASISGMYASVSIADSQFMNLGTSGLYRVIVAEQSELIVRHSMFSMAGITILALNSYGAIVSNSASSSGADLLYLHGSHSSFLARSWDVIGNRLGPCADDVIDVANFDVSAVPCMIEGNIVSNAADKGVTCRSPAIVRNNVAVRCRLGLDVTDTSCDAANNTFVYCTNGVGFSTVNTQLATIANSIVWNPGVTNSQMASHANFKVVNCNISGTGIVVGAGNLNVSPEFVDLVGGDYRLAANSPCINVGTNQDWMTNALDAAGSIRLQGPIVDMGAFESDVLTSNLPPVPTNRYVWLNSPSPGCPMILGPMLLIPYRRPWMHKRWRVAG